MIEKGHEVEQVLEGSWISLCLDTGHLLIGGTDPAELARQAPSRIEREAARGSNRQGSGCVGARVDVDGADEED
jgi:inosose dehydratase